jgi:hypothetical protein
MAHNAKSFVVGSRRCDGLSKGHCCVRRPKQILSAVVGAENLIQTLDGGESL